MEPPDLRRIARGLRRRLPNRTFPTRDAGLLPVFPGNWFTDRLDFAAGARRNAAVLRAQGRVEAQLAAQAGSFALRGFCAMCARPSLFHVDRGRQSGVEGSAINWREQLVCRGCGLNNRIRAAVHLMREQVQDVPGPRLYLPEHATPLHTALRQHFEDVVSSAFLGAEIPLGHTNAAGVRNEDLTALTFADQSFDVIVCLDVLEHVPNYRRALAECLRCLKPGGALILTAPFLIHAPSTLRRASVDAAGRIVHHLPPEYHHDPIAPDEILCYYHFGWDLLDLLRSHPSSHAAVVGYWSDLLMYLGPEQSLVVAAKAA